MQSRVAQQRSVAQAEHENDLTSAVGGPSSLYAEPKGYAFEAQGSQHVIYTDDIGHIVELYWKP